MSHPRPTELTIDGLITARGIDIFVNRDRFPIVYPQLIWQKTSSATRQILRDNITHAATMFLPQIFKLNEITYGTARPIAEPVLFKMGIYDMPDSAETDRASSLSYLKRFFNTRYQFAENRIILQRGVDPSNWRQLRPIILFSFGKESLLNFALCRELGIDPVLVMINEPSNTYEFEHKRRLIPAFERQFKTKIHCVTYHPGWFRYGRYWGQQTELGWGVQLMEYLMLTVPLVECYRANAVIVGNEHSCDDWSWDSDGLRMYEAGYDQHSAMTPHQGVILSQLVGRRVDVLSFVEPLGELAEMVVLHRRYPAIGVFQTSCFADNDAAKNRRWCQRCFKCDYVFALLRGLGIDPKRLGFTADLFKRPSKVYTGLFAQHAGARSFGDPNELTLALYWAMKRGDQGAAIDQFRPRVLANAGRRLPNLRRSVLAVHEPKSLPPTLATRLTKIYRHELTRFNP